MTKANLAPESALWGRTVEKRLHDLEVKTRNLSALIASSNNRLDAILSAQNTIAATQTLIVAAQNALDQTQVEIAQTQNALNAQVAFLAGQTVTAEASPDSFTSNEFINLTENVEITWLPFDSNADAVVEITIPSTGNISVQASGFAFVHTSNNGYGSAFIGVEVIDTALGFTVKAPSRGDGFVLDHVSATTSEIDQAGSGQIHLWPFFTPGRSYTFRARRGYLAYTGGSTSYVRVGFQGTGLTISKVGM